MHRTTAVDEAIDQLRSRARRDVDDGLLGACQWALAHEGEVVAAETVGTVPAGDDTRFLIYSCTKALVGAAVWQLLGEGSLRLEDRVVDHIPEFAGNGKEAVTVEHVLLHVGGFPHAPFHPPGWESRQERLEAFGRWRLSFEPGTAFEYHATSGHWVLAELLARIDGADHRDAVRRRVLDPLGLRSLALGVPVDEQDDLLRPTSVGEPATAAEWQEALGIDGIDVGEVTDEALVVLGEPANVAAGLPGGGAVSTATDLARFYQSLLHDPDGLWDPGVLADATGHVRNTFPDPQTGVPANRALSVVLAGDDGLAAFRGFGHTTSARAFGHNGAGGQIAWADPETGISFAWLTNGHDAHLIRQWKRTAAIASRAGAVGTAIQ